MFGPLKALFKSGEPQIKVIDKIWMSSEAKYAACKAMAAVNPHCVFITWFEETHALLSQVLGDGRVLLAKQIPLDGLPGKMIVFAEHYPLLKKEIALFTTLQLKEVPILSSLDDPLFMRFGGERTIELMKKLGMKDDEVVGHAFITKSIQNAQQKIEKQVTVEREANSQHEWFALNMPVN